MEPVAPRFPPDELALFNALPADGSAVSNPSLRRYLRWTNDRYFAARDGLVDKGLVSRGPGRGGVVRRADPQLPAPEHGVALVVGLTGTDAEVIEAAITSEIGLYEPMQVVIAQDWAQDRRQDLLAVEITAYGNGRSTGIWTRPDITAVQVRTFEYVPGKHLEIITFEVKAPNAINVQAVYEALAHRRAATRSYVLFYIPPERATALAEDVADVASVARSHGIGVVTAGDPSDYETWDEIVEPRRLPADPERLDAFIREQLSPATRSRIALLLR